MLRAARFLCSSEAWNSLLPNSGNNNNGATEELVASEAHTGNKFSWVPPAGMIACIVSLFLCWEQRDAAQMPGAAGSIAAVAPGALFADKAVRLNGYQVGANGPVTVAALLCGALFLIPVSTRNRSALQIAQGLCGIVLLMAPLHYISNAGLHLYTGTGLATLGAAAMLFGVLERWRSTQ